jgi:deoxycytidine triphosphate deaminase
MSIKSDNWIRRMAREHGLIEPFEPGQVRESAAGRVISYGTSSYGYDVRCAPEFKIFTNINSTIVDPKQFDAKSFVDVTSDVCIIPPNSFALARTVEYFRIPRNVLVVCLGKCVTGDTRVVDAETGAYGPITEMRFGKTTLALDGWQLKPAKVSAFIPQGEKQVFELRTRAGLRIRATATHPFRMLNGWRALADLRPGDRIAAAGNIPVFGKTNIPDWEATLLGLMISEGQCNTPGHSPTCTSSDPALVRLLETAVAACDSGEVPFNGRYGKSGEKFVPQSIFMAPEQSVRLFLQALFGGDGGLLVSGEAMLLEYSSKSRRLIEDVHHLLLRFGIFSLIREKTTAFGTRACAIQITDKVQIRRFADKIGFTPDSIKQRRLEMEVLPMIRAQPWRRSNFDTSLNALDSHPSDQSVPMAAAVRVARRTGDLCVGPLLEGPMWDVVETIESVGTEKVFDISVPTLHNFVANDLVVHNSTYARCGVIVNVTPLEPEWEGHVTLEFSNTTTLPAKIYANEGIAQMLFFESDEVCETSYADRGGKYQGQKGVTLPKA